MTCETFLAALAIQGVCDQEAEVFLLYPLCKAYPRARTGVGAHRGRLGGYNGWHLRRSVGNRYGVDTCRGPRCRLKLLCAMLRCLCAS